MLIRVKLLCSADAVRDIFKSRPHRCGKIARVKTDSFRAGFFLFLLFSKDFANEKLYLLWMIFIMISNGRKEAQEERLSKLRIIYI